MRKFSGKREKKVGERAENIRIMLLPKARYPSNSYFKRRDKAGLTSSPSLRSLGAETYARLRTRSCPGLVTCDKTTVSPERTDFTRASRGMIGKRATAIG